MNCDRVLSQCFIPFSFQIGMLYIGCNKSGISERKQTPCLAFIVQSKGKEMRRAGREWSKGFFGESLDERKQY